MELLKHRRKQLIDRSLSTLFYSSIPSVAYNHKHMIKHLQQREYNKVMHTMRSQMHDQEYYRDPSRGIATNNAIDYKFVLIIKGNTKAREYESRKHGRWLKWRYNSHYKGFHMQLRSWTFRSLGFHCTCLSQWLDRYSLEVPLYSPKTRIVPWATWFDTYVLCSSIFILGR